MEIKKEKTLVWGNTNIFASMGERHQSELNTTSTEKKLFKMT